MVQHKWVMPFMLYSAISESILTPLSVGWFACDFSNFDQFSSSFYESQEIASLFTLIDKMHKLYPFFPKHKAHFRFSLVSYIK